MSIKQKAISGVVWSTVQNWGGQFGSLLVFFILARLLAPEDFGLIALANVFLAFMSLFLEQGFGQAIIQRRDLEPEHLNTAFWINLGIGALLTLIGMAVSGLVANAFDQPELTPVLQWISLMFVIGALGQVQQSVLERQFKYKVIATRQLLSTVIGGVTGITMAFLGFGVWSLVAQQMLYGLVGTVTLWMCSDWRPGLKVSKRHFQDLFGIGMHIMGFNYLSFVNTKTNDFLVGYFFSPVDLGYYSVAYKMLNAVTQLMVKTSRNVALPTFSRLQEDLDRFRRAFYSATQLTSAIAMPTFLGMAVLAPELVLVLFGEQWLASVPLMQVLALMGMLRSITFFKGSVFVAMGKPVWWLRLSALNAVLSLVAFGIAYRWGILAVAIATVIRSYIVFPIGQWAICQLIQESLGKYLRIFISPLVSSIAMAGVIWLLKQGLGPDVGPLTTIVVSSVVGGAVYLTLIRLLAPKLFDQALDIARIIVSRPKTQS